MNAFPRGVVSARLQRAFVTDRSGAVMAVDLEDGHVAWRAGRQLRPLAVVGDVLLALQVGLDPHLVLLDTADGRTMRSGSLLGLPRWAVPSLTDTASFTITAAPQDTSAVVRWTAQDRYEGGAAPPAEVVRAASRDAHGAVRVHIPSGVVEPLPVGEPPSTGPTPASAAPSPDPDVLEQQDLEDVSYQLVMRRTGRGTAQLRLHASDRSSGRRRWETVIDEQPRSAPPRPRP